MFLTSWKILEHSEEKIIYLYCSKKYFQRFFKLQIQITINLLKSSDLCVKNPSHSETVLFYTLSWSCCAISFATLWWSVRFLHKAFIASFFCFIVACLTKKLFNELVTYYGKVKQILAFILLLNDRVFQSVSSIFHL